MSLAAIKALPVRELAADDAVLLLWATDPLLQRAFEVIEAWGFAYKTVGFYWVKLNRGRGGPPFAEADFFTGLGFWTRANPSRACWPPAAAPGAAPATFAASWWHPVASTRASPTRPTPASRRWSRALPRAVRPRQPAGLGRLGPGARPVRPGRRRADPPPAVRRRCAQGLSRPDDAPPVVRVAQVAHNAQQIALE
jgi:hypothetical protein